jgi:cytochrome bd-type quinol oxidase subunit 1
MISVSQLLGLGVRCVVMVWLWVLGLSCLAFYVAWVLSFGKRFIWSVYAFVSDSKSSQSVCSAMSIWVLSVVSDFVLCTHCNISIQFVYQCV